MFPSAIDFDNRAMLWLLALLPLLWVFSHRSLAGLGPWRRAAALVTRSIVLTLVVLALAEMQLVRTRERLTVICWTPVSPQFEK